MQLKLRFWKLLLENCAFGTQKVEVHHLKADSNRALKSMTVSKVCCILQVPTILHNYFNLHICPFFRHVMSCHVTLSIPAILLQNITNKSCVACYKNEKNTFSVTLRLRGSMRQGKAELRTLCFGQGGDKLHLLKLTSIFHHLCVCPKHLCAIAHLGCTREADALMYDKKINTTDATETLI